MHNIGENVDYSINVNGQPPENYFPHQINCQMRQKILKEPKIRRKIRVVFLFVCFNNLRVRDAFLKIRQNPMLWKTNKLNFKKTKYLHMAIKSCWTTIIRRQLFLSKCAKNRKTVITKHKSLLFKIYQPYLQINKEKVKNSIEKHTKDMLIERKYKKAQIHEKAHAREIPIIKIAIS